MTSSLGSLFIWYIPNDKDGSTLKNELGEKREIWRERA